MCTDTGDPGGLKIIGRKLDEVTWWTVINLSSDFFHITITPPTALDLVIAKTGSYFSSVLNSQEYSPWKGDMQ